MQSRTPTLAALVALRTDLRKQAHDHHRKISYLERVSATEAQRDLAAWRNESKDIAKLRR